MDFDYHDIAIVSKYANVDRLEAEDALVKTKGDITQAILLLTTK